MKHKYIIVAILLLAGCSSETSTPQTKKAVIDFEGFQRECVEIITKDEFTQMIIKDVLQKDVLPENPTEKDKENKLVNDNMKFQWYDEDRIFFSNPCGEIFYIYNSPEYYKACRTTSGEIKNFRDMEWNLLEDTYVIPQEKKEEIEIKAECPTLV
jgi:uncharacterized protein YcfL